MAKAAKITSKGQVTIPMEVRQALGVGPGDHIAFERHGRRMHVVPVRKESPFAKYRGIGNPGIGTGRQAIIDWVHELRGE